MGAPNLVPDNMDNSLSYSVITYLKKLKNQVRATKLFNSFTFDKESTLYSRYYVTIYYVLSVITLETHKTHILYKPL